jgi:hypothetical protein
VAEWEGKGERKVNFPRGEREQRTVKVKGHIDFLCGKDQ